MLWERRGYFSQNLSVYQIAELTLLLDNGDQVSDWIEKIRARLFPKSFHMPYGFKRFGKECEALVLLIIMEPRSS